MINLFIFLTLLLLNEIFPRIISASILSVNLLFIIIFAGLSILFPLNSVYKLEKKLIHHDYIFIVLLGTLLGYITFINVVFSTGMAYLSGFLILIITIIIFFRVLKVVSEKKK